MMDVEELELKYASPEAFSALREYMITGQYDGSLEDDERIRDIVDLANRTGIDGLKSLVVQMILERDEGVTKNTCLQLLHLGQKYEIDLAKDAVLEWMTRTKVACWPAGIFAELQMPLLKRVLQRKLQGNPDKSFVGIAAAWVMARPEERAGQMLALVRSAGLERLGCAGLVDLCHPGDGAVHSSEAYAQCREEVVSLCIQHLQDWAGDSRKRKRYEDEPKAHRLIAAVMQQRA